MAASSMSVDWRKILDKHDIFRYLRKNNDFSSNHFKASNLLHVRDGELYVWSSHDLQLLTLNLKTLTQSMQPGHSDSSNRDETTEMLQTTTGYNNVRKEHNNTFFQHLLCTDSPRHAVDRLVFNTTGSHVALVGLDGISVIQLPHRWGKNSAFEGGKEKIICKTIPLAEHFFETSGQKLLKAAWHPESHSDSHLVLLTSDNSLRIYDIQDTQKPLEVCHLKRENKSRDQSPSKLGIENALGETAVSFDFGLPVELFPQQQLGLVDESVNELEALLAWPIYILYGNGNVYTVTTCLQLKYSVCSKLQGPLSMYPPAEDNYGTDACSLHYLPSQPPVLVVATCEGRLHHCLVLNAGEEDATQENSVNDSSRSFPAFQPLPMPRLYVYETVELEFSLTTVSLETDETLLDDYTCPIYLHSDGSSLDRYHCSHNAGVHTVALPWVHRLQQFCDTDNLHFPTVGTTHQAIVEHLICTKPSPSSSPCPIIGLTVSKERLLGPPTLFCLTSSLRIITFPLLSIYHTPSVSLLDGAPGKSIPSPLRQFRHEPFEQYIRKLLKRDSSIPRLDIQSNKECPPPQECFQLLSRITQVFREEYIEKQHLARAEIEKRVRILGDQKCWQQADLQVASQSKNILTEGAHNLADKLDTANDRHQHLKYRVETVLKKLQERVPLLSEAERIMHKELTDMQYSLSRHTSGIQQLKRKQEYQHRQMSQSTRSKDSSPLFSRDQTQQLRSALKNESDEIGRLVHQVGHLRTSVDT